jgi:hypothetical protein
VIAYHVVIDPDKRGNSNHKSKDDNGEKIVPQFGGRSDRRMRLKQPKKATGGHC